MKKIMSLILALTMILSVGSLVASAASTEATNVTTVAPVNYANEVFVDALYSANGSLKAANVFEDNDNEIFTTGTSDANYYLKFSDGIGNKTNNTRNTDNVWFMVEFAEEQAISAIYLDQWKDRIINYRIFATSDDTIATEVKSASTQKVGLSEHGGKLEWKTKNTTTNKYEVSETVNYNGAYGTYTIDKLINAGALVKSGNLGGTNKITTTKNTVVFDKVKKAKYLIFVVDSVPSSASSSSVVLDYIKLLSFENDTEVEFEHSPLYNNYADQTKFPNVKAAISSKATDGYTVAKKGNPNVIVNSTLTDTASEFLNANVLALPSSIPTWFAIDLGEARTFGQIDIYQLRDRIKTVEVRALKDSATGDILGDGTATTHGYFQAKTNGGGKLSENFINNYTTLITTANIYHTGESGTILNETSLDTPSTIVLPEEFTCRYLLIQITDLVNAKSGTPIIEVHVKNKTPKYNFEQTWDGEGSLNYTAKLINDKATAQRMAVAVVQYKADKTIAETNISYVDVDAISGKSFSGTIEKADEAVLVKVFTWSLNTLVPELNAYTFNIQ